MALLALTMLTWQKRFEQGLTPPPLRSQHRAYRMHTPAQASTQVNPDDDFDVTEKAED